MKRRCSHCPAASDSSGFGAMCSWLFFSILGVTDDLHGLLLSQHDSFPNLGFSRNPRDNAASRTINCLYHFLENTVLDYKGLQRSEISSNGEKSKYFAVICCHILSESLVLWPQSSWIRLKDQQTRQISGYLTSSGLCLQVPVSISVVLCRDTIAYAGCQWTCLMTFWIGNNRFMCSVFYFQILFIAAKMEIKFNSNYHFHKQWIIQDKLPSFTEACV